MHLESISFSWPSPLRHPPPLPPPLPSLSLSFSHTHAHKHTHTQALSLSLCSQQRNQTHTGLGWCASMLWGTHTHHISTQRHTHTLKQYTHSVSMTADRYEMIKLQAPQIIFLTSKSLSLTISHNLFTISGLGNWKKQNKKGPHYAGKTWSPPTAIVDTFSVSSVLFFDKLSSHHSNTHQTHTHTYTICIIIQSRYL